MAPVIVIGALKLAQILKQHARKFLEVAYIAHANYGILEFPADPNRSVDRYLTDCCAFIALCRIQNDFVDGQLMPMVFTDWIKDTK